MFTFPMDIGIPTNDRHVLIATAGFENLNGGVTPDFTIPSNFFDPAGDTINFAGVHEVTFDANAPVPTDNVNSFNYTVPVIPLTGDPPTTAVNSPTNYAGDEGQLNFAAPTGDYNGDGTVNAADYPVWSDTRDQTIQSGTGADGSGDGTINQADYQYWKDRFGNVIVNGGTTIPEPGSVVLVLLALMTTAVHRHRAD